MYSLYRKRIFLVGNPDRHFYGKLPKRLGGPALQAAE
jgi:hypothetical protein